MVPSFSGSYTLKSASVERREWKVLIRISYAVSQGILLKGGEALDALARCDTVAFDKTGTLTTGDLTCKAIEPLYGHSQGRNSSTVDACCSPDCEVAALAVAAAMERGATHPIAR